MAFASLNELAIRLGRSSSSDLTAAQQAQGTQLLDTASDLITIAVDRDSGWVADLVTTTPAYRLLRAVCLEMAHRVMTNPAGARSESETLGQHQHSISFTDGSHLLQLTDREEKLVRRAAVGATSGSAALESLATVVAASRPLPIGVLADAGSDDPPLYTWTD